MSSSGLAELVADGLVGVFDAWGPRGVLLGVVLATLVLTEMITNNAAALLMFPIAVATAAAGGLDPRGAAIAVAVAASASFLTPIGYQTNTMVYGPGGYRFGDYARLGFPLTILNRDLGRACGAGPRFVVHRCAGRSGLARPMHLTDGAIPTRPLRRGSAGTWLISPQHVSAIAAVVDKVGVDHAQVAEPILLDIARNANRPWCAGTPSMRSLTTLGPRRRCTTPASAAESCCRHGRSRVPRCLLAVDSAGSGRSAVDVSLRSGRSPQRAPDARGRPCRPRQAGASTPVGYPSWAANARKCRSSSTSKPSGPVSAALPCPGPAQPCLPRSHVDGHVTHS